MNYLNAVFWDYPRFTDKQYLKKFLRENKKKDIYFWVMQRFVEHGRVVDAMDYFKIKEISTNINRLKLSTYSRKKWERLIEVYDKF